MVSLLNRICDRCIRSDPEFWLLVGLTDASYETGGSVCYRRAVDSFAAAGLRPGAVDRLRLGLNGILAGPLEAGHRDLRPVRANLRHGRVRPDLCFGSAGDVTETLVEVKGVFDLTLRAFYGNKGHGVADDRDKLLTVRRQGFAGHLLQAVFFVELPNYAYPSGRSYAPAWKWHYARRHYQRCCGIDAQFRETRKHLGEPAWASDAPRVVRLPSASRSIQRFVVRWLNSAFRPDDPAWRFDAAEHLGGAAVGYAIWEY
jgi:hypothetical protein